MAAGANVNIYFASAHALAECLRRAANLMRVLCLSQEGNHFNHLSRKQAKYGRK